MYPHDSGVSSPNLDHAQSSEAYGGPELPYLDSLYECLQKGLIANPDGVAFIAIHQTESHLADTVSSKGPDDVECLHWTYRQINEASLKLATYLAERCPPGQRRLACFVWSSIEHAILYWASAHLRGVFVPLEPGLLDPGREETCAWYMKLVKPDIVVSIDHALKLDSVLPAQAVKISLADQVVPDPWQSFPSLLRGITVDPTGTITHDTPADPKAPVQIFFTSGTTAFPKGVVHSAAKMSPVSLKAATVYPKGMVQIATLSPFRPAYNMYLLTTHQAGCTLLISGPRFTSASTISACLRYKPHVTLFIPAQMRLIMAEAARMNVTIDSLTYIFLSGDTITSDLLNIAPKTFPNAVFRGVMGMTEVYGVSNYAKLRDPLPALPNNIITMGMPANGYVIRICLPGTFEPTKRGEPGELWVTGQSVLDHYLENRDADHFRTAPDLKGTERDWFYTGDMALLDEKDQIFVLGRYKDIIIRGGRNLSPVAMEFAFQKLGYSECHVVGIPDVQLGAVPVAVIRDLNGKSASSIADDVARMLGEDYRPQHVWTLQDLGLGDWEYNTNEKISKTDLQARIKNTVLKKL